MIQHSIARWMSFKSTLKCNFLLVPSRQVVISFQWLNKWLFRPIKWTNTQAFVAPKCITCVYKRQAFFSAKTLMPGGKASRRNSKNVQCAWGLNIWFCSEWTSCHEKPHTPLEIYWYEKKFSSCSFKFSCNCSRKWTSILPHYQLQHRTKVLKT